MGKADKEKTNAMRILDSRDIVYNCFVYDNKQVNAVLVANVLGQNPEAVFKTLVTVGKSNEHYVFMIPGSKELDLKKAARAAGEKFLEMIPQKELLPITGYVHGGCSPVGMKKQFKTFIDASAESFDMICFSGGQPGLQVQTPLSELRKVVPVVSADIVKNN